MAYMVAQMYTPLDWINYILLVVLLAQGGKLCGRITTLLDVQAQVNFASDHSSGIRPQSAGHTQGHTYQTGDMRFPVRNEMLW